MFAAGRAQARTWYFQCSATNRAREEWQASTGEERTARSWTVERWLRYWLSTTIRATTKPQAFALTAGEKTALPSARRGQGC